jgi:Uma2 family endonuclease
MGAATTLMTVDEFRRLPEPTDGTYYELHHGELVQLTLPKFGHQRTQKRIAGLLAPLASARGEVFVEFGFRVLPEYDARRADVAYVAAERIPDAVRADEFFGAPDLAIEILSPSNTAAEMDDKEALCFANGCREFWIVNGVRQTVRVTRAGGPTRWYGRGERIPLDLLGGAEIPVDAILDEG